jgi:hypothetical protein
MDTAIEKLKQRYVSAIKQKESELLALQNKLAVIEEIDQEVRNFELDLGSNKYAGKGMTEAILDAISDIGRNGATPSQITKHLLANGFKSTSENVIVSVHTTLRRLAEQKRVQMGDDNGKRIYLPEVVDLPRFSAKG